MQSTVKLGSMSWLSHAPRQCFVPVDPLLDGSRALGQQDTHRLGCQDTALDQT